MLTILELMEQAHANSKAHGFYDDEDEILKVVPACHLHNAVLKAFFGLKIALIHTEVSEALEGLRMGIQDQHCPQFNSEEIELADAMIRIADLAKRHRHRLEEAIIAKMKYNKSRPYKHGKAY